MIQSIHEDNITIVCPFCNYATTYDTSDITVRYNEELQEYPILYFKCECTAENGVNLNIATSDEEEGLESEKISAELESTRFYVRLLQRMVREDFKEEGN